MREHPLVQLVLEAHTDSDGPRAYNKNLSERRAQAVAHVLVKVYKTDAKRITAIGYGEDKPLVPNDSKTNKAKNRRVYAVFSVLK